MNKWWPQQSVFAERVKQFCKERGLLTKRGAVQMDVLAEMFGISEDVLRRFLQDSTRKRPHIKTLTRIASVLKCSVLLFLDVPSDAPPTITPEHWTEMAEDERALLTSLLADFSSDDLSLAEKQLLYKVFQQTKEKMLQLKELWAASARKKG